MSALQTLRQILSMHGDNPPFVFTSIELVRPGFGFSEASAQPGEQLTFWLGHKEESPERLTGHLFNEVTGHLIRRLKSEQVQSKPGTIRCTFTMPAKLTAQKVCLVIEGERAGREPGGCEMSFSITS